MGLQALIWGGIDAAVALVGRWLARRRQAAGLSAAELQREEGRLRRVLYVNAALDVLYVGSGLLLAFTMGAGEPLWRGHGWGIVVQGAFLFFFDLLHARLPVSALPAGAGGAPDGPGVHHPADPGAAGA